MALLVDEDGIPFGWEDVPLTPAELDEMCDAVFAGDEETAELIVEAAYGRLFGESIN